MVIINSIIQTPEWSGCCIERLGLPKFHIMEISDRKSNYEVGYLLFTSSRAHFSDCADSGWGILCFDLHESVSLFVF